MRCRTQALPLCASCGVRGSVERPGPDSLRSRYWSCHVGCQLDSFGPTMLVMCGSVNRVSADQCAYACEHGAPAPELPLDAKLDPGWVDTEEAASFIEQTVQTWSSSPVTVLDNSERFTRELIEGSGRVWDVEAIRSAVCIVPWQRDGTPCASQGQLHGAGDGRRHPPDLSYAHGDRRALDYRRALDRCGNERIHIEWCGCARDFQIRRFRFARPLYLSTGKAGSKQEKSVGFRY